MLGVVYDTITHISIKKRVITYILYASRRIPHKAGYAKAESVITHLFYALPNFRDITC